MKIIERSIKKHKMSYLFIAREEKNTIVNMF